MARDMEQLVAANNHERRVDILLELSKDILTADLHKYNMVKKAYALEDNKHIGAR